MAKYRKNFILCGDIDHYCLLCQELFQGTPDVEKHIRWEKHRQSLKNQAYFPKFRKEFIYKVANHFYCEVCNFVVSDMSAAKDHINNEKHKSLKNNPKIEAQKFMGHYDSGYIIINRIILNMAQWNSIVDKKCFVCNVDVHNVIEHTAKEEHIIKLIQSETKYEDERCYRMINKNKYHCFSCKKVFSALNFENHWSNCTIIDEIDSKKLKEGCCNKSIGIAAEDNPKMDELHKQLIGTLKDFYHLDTKHNFAVCKFCKEVVGMNFKPMIEHMKMKHDEVPKTAKSESSEEEVVYTELIDSGKRRAELKAYGRENSIKLNYKGSKGWCLLCDLYMSAHKNIFKQHVKGATHKSHLELQRNPKGQAASKFKTKSILQCNLQYSYDEQEFYINENFCIDVYSFFLLHQIEDDPHFKKTKCYVCIELFPQGQEREHCQTAKHKNKFFAAKYLIPVPEFGDHRDSEFVRELRPNIFHCGFCNKTFPYMKLLNKHQKSYAHLFAMMNKTDCQLATVKFNTKSDDVYMKLLHYGFGSA